MSKFRIPTLVLSLGLAATAAYADDGGWGTAPSRPAPAQIGRPVAVSTPAAAPAALLERPRTLVNDGAADPLNDAHVRPASFAPVHDDLSPVIRGQAPDAAPLPPGPAPAGEPIAGPRNWQRPIPGQVVDGPVVGPQPDPTPSDCDGGCCRGPIWSLFGHGACCGCKGGVDGDCCDAAGCFAEAGCGDGCCPQENRFYVSAEYLLWETKGDPTPPLVTAGSAGDLLVPGVSAGALGRPGTVTLFGGSDLDDHVRSGGRIRGGWWLGDEHVLGIEGGGFFLAPQTTNFTASSSGAPLLARPFFNVLTGLQDSEFVAEPGNAAVPGVGARDPLAGTVSASVRTSFWGAEANLRSNLCCSPCLTVDGIAGYRYLGLDDNLSVTESLQDLATGTTFGVTDAFKTTNRFNAGQVGFDAEWRRNRWFLDLRTTVALGNVSERVTIAGTTAVNGVSTLGGLLAQPSNIGTYSRNKFAWSPDVGLNLGYQFTDHLRGFVGYNYLYLSDVVRAGDQVDLRVNTNQLQRPVAAGGPALPAFTFHGSDFWAQGVNFGLEFRY